MQKYFRDWQIRIILNTAGFSEDEKDLLNVQGLI